ncbi:hypothetical protein [Nocardioides lacusdianchii]|uniref:hypothetical protein n=1 Tax=Nocardioides lacusdianchii TaxID=2783664 RepID=UPI001CC932A4|nr:hypothetical protein [Nocardioides lacusdianchii]
MSTHRTDAAPLPGSDEAYVRTVIEAAMADARPPLDLPGAALARGRRLRARRRVTVAAAAVAAGLAVGAAGPWLAAGGGAATRSSDLVATQPAAPEPGLPQTPSGWWDMPANEMVETLTGILPDGVILTATGPLAGDTEQGGPAHGFINSTLGVSAGGEVATGNVNIMMWPARTAPVALEGVGAEEATFEVGVQDGWLTCPGDLGPSTTSCTEIRGPGGERTGRRSTTVMGDVRIVEVVVVFGDGIVYGATANTDDDKWGAESPITAPRPPLTMAQLEAIVRDQVWTSYQP